MAIPPGLSNIVAVAGGTYHSLALSEDGTVTAWGMGFSTPPDLTNAVAIKGGGRHSLALRSDGTVVAWGVDNVFYTNGQTNAPEGLSNVVAIAAGESHCLALRADGTVVAWGSGTNVSVHAPSYGQSIVPADLTNAIGIAAGGYTSFAVRSDGSLRAWGYNSKGQTNPPSGLHGVVQLDPGFEFGMALVEDLRFSIPVVISNSVWSGASFNFSIPTQLGKVYSIEHTDTLLSPNWSITRLIVGNGGEKTVSLSSSGDAQAFYRVRRW